jgi:hypothetical protein
MPPERRSHPRKPVTSAYGINLLAPSGMLMGVAVPADVSPGGLRADTSREYAAGEALRVEVCSPHRLAGRQFSFVVAWSNRVAGGWQIGGSFTAPLTGEEADALAGG